MTPEPIVEEPDDIEFSPGTVANASSNGIALSGNNAAQELSVLNVSGKNDLSACIAALPVPKRPAQVQRSGWSVVDFIPVINVIKAGVDMGIDCHQNNKNRESYNQDSIRYNETVRQLAQKQVDIVKEQCSTIRENHSRQCDTAIQIDKQRCETWLKAKEKEAKNRELEINKNTELELERIQQNALTEKLKIEADVKKDKALREAEVKNHYISEFAKVEQHRTEKRTELAKEKVKLKETKSKHELELKTLQENNALEGRKMEAECAERIEQEKIKSNERLRALELLLGMNANRRNSSNYPGTSSSSSTSSPQNENSSPPAFQSILIICYYNRSDSAFHCQPFGISAERRLRDVANYLLTSDETQSLSNVQIDNSASKLVKIPDNMNAQEFSSILCAQDGPPLDDFEGVSELNTIDIMIINGYCHQIKVHFG